MRRDPMVEQAISGLELERQIERELVCIGCGCCGDCACPGGCSWVAFDAETGVGICSVCAAKPLDQLLAEGGLRVEDPHRGKHKVRAASAV